MSVTAAELRKLAALQLSPEQMAGVLEVLASRLDVEEAQKAAEVERKAIQAERKRRSRDKAVTVTGQSENVTVTDDKKERSPEPPKEKTTPLPARGSSVQENLAFDAYNDLASEIGLCKAQSLTEERRAKITARLNECGGTIGWLDALAKVRGSPFLRGDNERGWKASLDFILQRKSFTNLMEGAYDRSERPQPSRKNHDRAHAFAVLDAVTDEAIRRADGHGPPCDEENSRELPGLRKSAA